MQVLERKKLIGEQHLDRLSGMHGIALIIKEEDRDRDALRIRVKCVQICLRTLRDDYRNSLISGKLKHMEDSAAILVYAIQSNAIPAIWVVILYQDFSLTTITPPNCNIYYKNSDHSLIKML